MGFSGLMRKWFPASPAQADVTQAMRQFYLGCREYHAMTSAGSKVDHPQVQLLLCLLEAGRTYVEIGCGSGIVCAEVGKTARVHGFDISPIAIDAATRRCSGLPVQLACADVTSLPLSDESADGCYSFEVLEHVWDPLAVLREMARVTRPGGFLLVSAPLGFSLDLYLNKNGIVRGIETAVAASRFLADRLTGRTHVHVTPHLNGAIYPDCDMITSLVPGNFAAAVAKAGFRMEFLDTTYMRAHRPNARTDLRFQKRTTHTFYREFGDHLLLLARKQ